MLVERNPDIKLSISATTRKPRQSEIDGKHYFFISHSEFQAMIEQDQFLEHAEVFGNCYGTPRKMVEDEIKIGNSVLFDIDWQGARQITDKCGKQKVISFFILPPSMEELHKRLQTRAEDSEEVVLKRMEKAKDEMEHFDEYDYVLVNHDLEKTYQSIHGLISNHDNQHPTLGPEIRAFVAQLLKSE
ncbi:MAG: guanylate kinase [Rickettsiaceae bacterium]|nr:guanylate kinase [Rickettsiaceae bacterium]